MKKIVGVTLLSTLVLSSLGFSSQAFATDTSVASSKATVEYTPGDDLSIDEDTDKDTNGDSIFGTGLPKDLYFGSHKNQVKTAENWTAFDKETLKVTEGTLKVDDARTTGAGWTLKVAQTSQFKNGNNTLSNAKLSIKTGDITNAGGVAPTTGANNTFKLDAAEEGGQEQIIFGAKVGEGNGKSSLKLKQFDLAVPIMEKAPGTYEAALTWTLTDVPMS